MIMMLMNKDNYNFSVKKYNTCFWTHFTYSPVDSRDGEGGS